jgi:hypothetical protein
VDAHPALRATLPPDDVIETLAIDSPIEDTPFMFGLRLAPNGEWLDLSLAKDVLQLHTRFPDESFLDFCLVIASFVVRFAPDFAMDFLSGIPPVRWRSHALFGTLVLRHTTNTGDVEPFVALEMFATRQPPPIAGYANQALREYHDATAKFLDHEIADAFFRTPLDDLYAFSREQGIATAMSIAFTERRAAKRWRLVWSHVTSDNATWSDDAGERFYKRDFCATVSFCPFRQKLNRRYENHAIAAQLRDSGRLKSPVERPEVDLHPFDIRDSPDEVVRARPCQIIKVTGVQDSTFGIHRDVMKIWNKIYYLHDTDYIFWRRIKFQLTGLEIFFRSGKSILIDFLKIESKAMANSILKWLVHLWNIMITMLQ